MSRRSRGLLLKDLIAAYCVVRLGWQEGNAYPVELDKAELQRLLSERSESSVVMATGTDTSATACSWYITA
ncbi:hypothetical protein [Azospirillum sp. sgz302134]